MKEMKWIHYLVLLALLAGTVYGTALITGVIEPAVSGNDRVSEKPSAEISLEAPAGASGEPETQAPTELPTEAPEEAPTEAVPQRFVLTFVGDCILGSNYNRVNAKSALPKTMGEDYAYPFRNVISYFEDDTYSFAVLENPLGDQGSPQKSDYAFRGDGAYTRILTENSVEAVTLANNHIYDYGQEGYEETKRLLEEAGVAYAEDESSTRITLDGGLIIGLYAADFTRQPPETEKMQTDIRALKESGVDLVVCAFHWGADGKYRATEQQIQMGHAAIDSGADVVWGSHPHVLQPIEQYQDGMIFYSLGSFVYGGNSKPKDFDTAIIRQEVIRESDGTVRLGELVVIPCSVSSESGRNNYQPTPYAQGSKEYNRVLDRLDISRE